MQEVRTLTVGQRKQREALDRFMDTVRDVVRAPVQQRTIIEAVEILVKETIDATYENVRAVLVNAGVL